MSKFFCTYGAQCAELPLPKTFLLVPEPQESGEVTVTEKCLELLDNPFAALTFDDFSIHQLLRRGIDLQSLNITKDMRLGHDSEFDELSARFDKFINEKEN